MEIKGNNLEKILKGPVIHGPDADYLVLPNGTFKKFYYISPEFNGFRVCQEKQNGTYRLVNRFSEIFDYEYEYLTTMEKGPALAKQVGERELKYIFPDNKTSAKFIYAEEFSDGRGLVLCDYNKYTYLNLRNKKMPKYFYEADSFSCAHAKVRRKKDELVRFLDLDGKIEKDAFASATGYFEGFATVQPEENGEKFKRDMLGNLTEKETTFGKMIYSYYCGEISLKDLVSHPKFTYDEKFKKFAIMFEYSKIDLRAFEEYMTEEEIDKAKEEKSEELYNCFKIYEKKSAAHFFR